MLVAKLTALSGRFMGINDEGVKSRFVFAKH